MQAPHTLKLPRRRTRRWTIGFAFIVPLLVQAQVLIPVINHDFETGGFGSDGFSNNPGVVPNGWSAANTLSGAFFGYFNPGNSAYIGTDGNSVNGTMDGPNVFYFGSASNGQGIQQNLATLFSSSQDYTLTIAIGERLLGSMASLQMDLLAGTTVIATRTAFNPAAGSFDDYSVTYTANAGDHGLDGQALAIRLLKIADRGPSGIEVDIDNVRLTTVPEPGTVAIAGGIGLLGVAIVRVVRQALTPKRHSFARIHSLTYERGLSHAPGSIVHFQTPSNGSSQPFGREAVHPGHAAITWAAKDFRSARVAPEQTLREIQSVGIVGMVGCEAHHAACPGQKESRGQLYCFGIPIGNKTVLVIIR